MLKMLKITRICPYRLSNGQQHNNNNNNATKLELAPKLFSINPDLSGRCLWLK